MLSERKKEEIKQYIHDRLNSVLEWYIDCAICEETLDRIRNDIVSVLYETEKKFNLRPIPNHFVVEFDPVTYILNISYNKDWEIS